MAWNEPGIPYETVIEGKRLKILPVTVPQRRKMREEVNAMAEQSSGRDAEDLYLILAPLVAEIEGVGTEQGQILEALSLQSQGTIIELWATILRNASLTEGQAKNSDSSSSASKPTAGNGSSTEGETVVIDSRAAGPSR